MVIKHGREAMYRACQSAGVSDAFLDAEWRAHKAEKLLSRCFDGFGAFINGRKMARADRDRLRVEIQEFLNGN